MASIEERLENIENELKSFNDFKRSYTERVDYHSQNLDSLTETINTLSGNLVNYTQSLNASNETLEKRYKSLEGNLGNLKRTLTFYTQQPRRTELPRERRMKMENFFLYVPIMNVAYRIYSKIMGFFAIYPSNLIYTLKWLDNTNKKRRQIWLKPSISKLQFIKKNGKEGLEYLFSQDTHWRAYLNKRIDSLDTTLGDKFTNLPPEQRRDFIAHITVGGWGAASLIYYQHLAPQILDAPGDEIVGLKKAEALKVYMEMIRDFCKDTYEQWTRPVINAYSRIIHPDAPKTQTQAVGTGESQHSSNKQEDVPLEAALLAGLQGLKK